MKHYRSNHRLVIALVSFIVFIAFQTLASPALANGPIIKEESWDGHIWQYDPFASKTFAAPQGAVKVEVEAEWGWSGNQNAPKQLNETHEVQLPNGQIIECDDYGDEELDGQWLPCGSTTFDWNQDLKVNVEYTGDNSSHGSHYFKVIIKWHGEDDPTPPVCNSVDLSIPSGSKIPVDGTTVDVGIQAVNATQYRLVETDTGAVIADPQGDNKFQDVQVLPDTSYQVQVRNKDFTWTKVGCEFHYTHAEDPSGTVNCNNASITNGYNFPIEVVFTVDGTSHFVSQVPANSIRLIDHTYNDDAVHQAAFSWSGNGHSGQVNLGSFGPCNLEIACTLTTSQIDKDKILVEELGAIDENGQPVEISDWKSDSNFDFLNDRDTADNLNFNSLSDLPILVEFPQEPGTYWVQFSVSPAQNSLNALSDEVWLTGGSCRLENEIVEQRTVSGQYQNFIGAVAFGTYTPYLEPGKEYFDSTRSVMFNVEYFNEEGQGEVVYRFNGQEISNVTTSIFNAGTFRQIESVNGRAVTTFNEGVTKLIAYRFDAERATIFQTTSSAGPRWIHPLDQPFEHKYSFELEIHGPAGVTDLLIYGDEQRDILYDENGLAVVSLTFTKPGLVAIYDIADVTNDVPWITVDTITFPITTSRKMSYDFAETGLYHYQVVDRSGQVVAGPSSARHITFKAEPGKTYYAQLVYPETSVFVGLYDDMKFEHTAYWTMPIDARFEHDFEFHLDYHRQDDPDLGNDHIRGDVVVDALYLINGTTSVAQQFPYGRHDGTLAGVTLVGIPNVSMVAFCQRPGVHEVVYWGGWENESYYLPDRGWIFDQEFYNEWTEEQHGDCIDAAHRVNMMLAREGLRTDHTYRHHGERSQGYQLVQAHAWSPYNLVGMYPPHVGQLLKPGTVLPYYEDPEDLLFWGWDLTKGGLADGVGLTELQQHIDSLGPVEYGDQTGIHPAEELNS